MSSIYCHAVINDNKWQQKALSLNLPSNSKKAAANIILIWFSFGETINQAFLDFIGRSIHHLIQYGPSIVKLKYAFNCECKILIFCKTLRDELDKLEQQIGVKLGNDK